MCAQTPVCLGARGGGAISDLCRGQSLGTSPCLWVLFSLSISPLYSAKLYYTLLYPTILYYLILMNTNKKQQIPTNTN